MGASDECVWCTMFTEMPYAAALNDDYLRIRCSNCFKPATKPCDKCQVVVYCDEKCAETDSIWHQVECPTLPQLNSSDIRLIARLAYRWRRDGGVAKLSEGFPANVKDRTCKDLMSHYRDMKSDPSNENRMKTIWENWQEHMSNSPLWSLKKSEVLRLYSTLCINTFGIYDSATIDSSHPWSIVGIGLYINVSRFNHSCAPQMFVQFDGLKLSVIKVEWKDDPANKKQSRPLTEKEFNRMTINYGVPQSDFYSPYVPLTSQRIQSLKSRYYFKCRCDKCTGRKSKRLEENASVFKCSKCKYPYVWHGRSMKLRQSCNCKTKPMKSGLTERVMAKKVSQMWDEAMREPENKSNMDEMIEKCAEAWKTAVEYWNPVINLRMGQLSERVFRIALIKVVKHYNELTEDQRAQFLQLALDAGEMMVAGYGWRLRNDPQMGLFYSQLALAYEMITSPNAMQRAHQLYTKSADIFKAIGDEANANIALQWRSKLNINNGKEKNEVEAVKG